MPTTRPRHFVTETDELAAALDAAARRWPGLTRPQLIVRLALEGAQAERQNAEDALAARRAKIRAASGVFNGVYRPDEIEQLRADWPE